MCYKQQGPSIKINCCRLCSLCLGCFFGFASKPWICLDLCLVGAGKCFGGESSSIPFGFTFLWGILNH